MSNSARPIDRCDCYPITQCNEKNEYTWWSGPTWGKKKNAAATNTGIHSQIVRAYIFPINLIRQKVTAQLPLYTVRCHILYCLQRTGWRIFWTPVTNKWRNYFIQVLCLPLLTFTWLITIRRRNGMLDLCNSISWTDTDYLISNVSTGYADSSPTPSDTTQHRWLKASERCASLTSKLHTS